MESSFYKQNTLPDLISAEAEPALPEKIGPYQVESLFSKGGMSFLYLGLHPEDKKPLVIKILSPSYINCPQAVDQFIKEAELISLASHPNIVKLYGQGEWERGLYISMELIRGVSLKQFIVQHSLSLKRSLEIILQVAYALHHLHSNQVIHRDLKPENILITEEGEVKVIDFGIAQLHEEKPSTSFVGTPNYMSPEQKENPSSVSFTTDIYSLGVILYELIQGKLSYGLLTLTTLPKKLKPILAKALAISSDQRYQNITDFIHDISLYLKSGSLEKEKPGSDAIKEIQEQMQKACLQLSVSEMPTFAQLDLGLAKLKAPPQFNLYFDTFHLPDDTYLIVLASSPSNSYSAPLSLALLKGILCTQLSYIAKQLHLPDFTTQLNTQFIQAHPQESLALCLIRLHPLNDMITYLSCGMPSLLHLPHGSQTVQTLSSHNEKLGSSPTSTFSEITTNWSEGDLLIAHTLKTDHEEDTPEQLALYSTLKSALLSNALLSAQPQAETLLNAASQSSAFAPITYAKAILSIQRMI